MGDSDIQAMLGLISVNENKRRKKKAAHKKSLAASHPAVVSVSKKSSSSSKSESKTKSKKNADDNLSLFHPSTWDDSFKQDFWNKLPAHSPLGHGLSWTLDQISRASYGATSGLEQLQNNEFALDDRYGNHGANPINDIIHPVQALHGVGDAIGEGFHLRHKVTSAQLIDKAYNASNKDHSTNMAQRFLHRHKVAKGITSFAFDVALDPTTYIGAGMVTKPYRAVKDLKPGTQVALSKELEGLGLKSGGVDRPISSKEYLDMMGKISTRRVAKGVTRAERRRFIKDNTLEGKNAYKNAADETRQTRNKIANLAKVKESIKLLDPRTHSRDLMIRRAYVDNMQRIFDKGINDAGVEHLRDFVSKIDAKQEAKSIGEATSGATPPVGKSYIGGEFTDMLDEATHVSELTRLVRAYGKRNGAQKKINTLISQKKTAHPDYAINLGKLDDAKAEMDDITDRWTFGNKDLGREEVYKTLDQMQALGESDPGIKSYYAQAGNLGRRMETATSDFEKNQVYGARREINFRKADRAKAIILKRLLGHKAEGTDISHLVDDPKQADRLKVIEGRRSELKRALKANPTKTEVKSAGEDIIDPKQLRDELAKMDKERNGILVDAINKSETASRVHPPNEVKDMYEAGASTKDIYAAVQNGDLTGEWADLFKEHMNERAVSARNPMIESKIRRRRDMVHRALTDQADVRDLPDNLQKMFTGKGKAIVPKVTKGDTEIKLTDKAELKKYETQTDRDKAAASDKVPKDKSQGDPSNYHGVDTTVTHPVHQYTFERLFQEEHGMSYQSAMDKMQVATGDYVQVANKAKISRTFFNDWARQNPQAIGPSGFGLAIKEGKETITYRKLMDEVGTKAHPISYTIRDAREEWTATVKDWMENTPTAEVNKSLKGVYESLMRKQRTVRKRDRLNEFNVGVPAQDINKMTEPQMLEHLGKDDFTGHFSNEEIKRMHFGARDQAIKDLNDEWSGIGNSSLSSVVGDKGYVLGASRDPESDLDDIKDTFMSMLDDDYRQSQIKGRDEVASASDKEGAAAKVQNDLAKKYAAVQTAKSSFLHGVEEAKQTQEALVKRLEEHMLLSAAAKADRAGQNSLRFTFAGNKFLPDVPTPEFLYKLTEKISDAPVINKAAELWANSFQPASKLSTELNKARLRAQSHTPELIKMAIKELHHTFGAINPSARRQAFKAYMVSGGKATGPITKKIDSEFKSLVPYLDGSTQIGDHYLTAWEVNRYLPNDFKLIHPKGDSINKVKIVEGGDIVKHMTQMGTSPDPMKALWSLRVAIEKSQADIALKNVIRDTFGVKRDLAPNAMQSESGKLVEQLHEGHGWTTVARELGTDHYFDPQTAEEINRLFDIMKPGKDADTMMQLYDKTQHIWKGAVTVYNPGYYTRNGIGEMIMGMFDGLVNPSYYKNAMKVMSHTRPDATKEALKQLDPWQALQKNKSTTRAGRSVAARLRGGRSVTVDEAEVLFSYAGLKSGFISTEYDHVFPRAGTARSTLPGRVATNINDKIRGAGEKYEDYFRMAHFLYRLEKAPKALTIEEAADWSAGYVRKYHFDYTDFTLHEKAIWMRVFPFYKWTRKAMPLMASMLFTRPGLVNFYPKLMQNAAYATGGTDPLQDKNGWLPNYQDSVPNWMSSLFSYPVGNPDARGAQDYGRIATPAMDIYGMLQNPASGALGMTSPLIKTPLEQITGQTMEAKSTTDPDSDFQYALTTPESRLNRVLSNTPITSLLNKERKHVKDPKKNESPFTEPGGKIDEALLSWLTGFGLYENDPASQPPKPKKGSK